MFEQVICGEDVEGCQKTAIGDRVYGSKPLEKAKSPRTEHKKQKMWRKV
jgi:hypothetical protein